MTSPQPCAFTHDWHTLHEKLYAKHNKICIDRSGSYFGLQAHPSSSTDAAGQSGSQSEAEQLNERLFELRVELQNLADDTTISVASIKRKVCPTLQEMNCMVYSSSMTLSQMGHRVQSSARLGRRTFTLENHWHRRQVRPPNAIPGTWPQRH